MYHCIQRYSARPIPRGRNRTKSATLSQDWRSEISEICREADTSNSALKFTQLKTQFNKMARCQIRFCHKKLNLCQARFSCSACPHAFLCFATFAALLFSAVQHLDSTLLFTLPLCCTAEDCCCLHLLCCSAGLYCSCLALPYAATFYAPLCSWLAPSTSSNVNAPPLPPPRLPSTLHTLLSLTSCMQPEMAS